MADLSAYILAGGRSSRMGRDKAFLDWHGESLLARALKLARTVTRKVCIVGQRQKFGAFAPIIEDIYTGQGPLGGIHAALTDSDSHLNLVLAVDTPLVTPEFLAYLVAQAEASGAVVTAPRVYEKTQPLCTVYRRAFAEVAAASLHAGRNKIEPLFASVTQRIIDEAELGRLAFDPRMFDNLNTPEEWEKAQSGS
jgi:molybdenum cofactor guanylyltransferase